MAGSTDEILRRVANLGSGGSSVAPDKGAFERLITGLDKPDAAVRATIGRMFGADTPTTREIYSGRGMFDARDLLNAFEEKYDVDLYFGDKDKEANRLQKIGNFATEMGIYLGISPVNALLKLPSSIVKGVMGSKKATAGSKLASRVATGATIGALTGDDPAEVATGALIGAGVLGAGAPALRAAGRAFSKHVGDPIVDASQKALTPEAFQQTKMGYSEAWRRAKSADKRYESIGREIRDMDTALGFANLGPEDSKKFAEFQDSKNSMFHTFRNDIETDFIKKTIGIEDVPTIDTGELFQARRGAGQVFGDRFVRMPDGSKGVARNGSSTFEQMTRGRIPKAAVRVDDFNGFDAIMTGYKDANGLPLKEVVSKEELGIMTSKANTHVGRVVDEELAKIGDPTLAANVKKHINRNRQMINAYNKFQRKRYGKDYVDVVPIDFHTYEVADRNKALGELDLDRIKTGLVRRRSSDPINTGGLTLQERLQLESERFGRSFMSRKEREAKRIINEVDFGSGKMDTMPRLKKAVGAYDKFTNFLKQQHLTMSHSWVVNNFADNVVKSYLAGGKSNLWKSALSQGKAAIRKSNDDLVSDLLKITDPNSAGKLGTTFSDDLTRQALDSGVIGEGFFSESFGNNQINEAVLKARLGSERAAEVIAEASNMSDAGKLYKKYSEFLANTVGRTGSLIEDSARMTTFKHTVDTITNSDDMLAGLGVPFKSDGVRKLIKNAGHSGAVKAVPELKSVYDEAARVVNETFFDYGNITAFEQKVMKRIFPYWTFFSKNLPMWLEAMARQPDDVNRIFSVNKSIGRTPTERERETIPDYLLEQGVRIGSNGNMLTVPNISLMDVASFKGGAMEKLHPLLKASGQLLFRMDDFGGELLPSETKQQRKRVFGSGVKFAPLTDSVYRDRKTGKLYTDSDVFQIFQMFQKNLLPVPIIDTAAKIIEDNKSKEIDFPTAILNLSPVKESTLSSSEKRKIKRFRLADKRRMARNKRRREQNR